MTSLQQIDVESKWLSYYEWTSGSNDSWATDKSIVFLDKEQVEKYFKDFKIEYFKEEEKDGISGSGSKHWHIHHIIAKKV